MQQILQLLDYLDTQEDAVLSYHASNMVLAVHSNASYLSKPKAHSWAGGHFFLSSNTTVPPNNGAMLNVAHIIKNILSSATEVELAGLYIMVCKAIYIRIILEELGHVQPPPPLQTDNAMADGIINGKVNPNEPKPWTWDSTGYAIKNANDNSAFTGDPESWTTPIIGQNITQKHIIVTCRKNFSHCTSFLKCYGWNNKVMQLTQHEEWPQQWHLARVWWS
jgi:hypothetical protein